MVRFLRLVEGLFLKKEKIMNSMLLSSPFQMVAVNGLHITLACSKPTIYSLYPAMRSVEVAGASFL
jgi:hypothetical protein